MQPGRMDRAAGVFEDQYRAALASFVHDSFVEWALARDINGDGNTVALRCRLDVRQIFHCGDDAGLSGVLQAGAIVGVLQRVGVLGIAQEKLQTCSELPCEAQCLGEHSGIGGAAVDYDKKRGRSVHAILPAASAAGHSPHNVGLSMRGESDNCSISLSALSQSSSSWPGSKPRRSER